MLLEFRLPSGSAGMAAGITYKVITQQIKDINSRHNTRIVEHLREGYRYIVECTEQDYTVLCLAWNSKNPWHRWRVIEARDLGEVQLKHCVKPGTSPLPKNGFVP